MGEDGVSTSIGLGLLDGRQSVEEQRTSRSRGDVVAGVVGVSRPGGSRFVVSHRDLGPSGA
jgi:hypothetical protein